MFLFSLSSTILASASRIPTSSASFYPLSSCHHCEDTLCCHPKNRLNSPSQHEPFLPWTSPFTSSLAGMKTPAKSLHDIAIQCILQAFVSASQQFLFPGSRWPPPEYLLNTKHSLPFRNSLFFLFFFQSIQSKTFHLF